MNVNETKTFHFNLEYAAGRGPFTLDTGDRRYELVEHGPESRAEHRGRNRALAALSDEQLARLTHFVAGAEVPADVARVLRVTFPLEGSPLPGVATMIPYIPAAARRAHRERHLERFAGRTPGALRALGSSATAAGAPAAEVLDFWADADLVEDSPYEVAKSLTFSHPQLASRNPDTAAIVMDDHIDTTDDLYSFAFLISSLGPVGSEPGWAKIAPSVDQFGEPLHWGPGYESEGHAEGEVVYYYDLNEAITGPEDAPPQDTSGLSVVNQSLRTSQNDPLLEGQCWSVNQGTPDLPQAASLTEQVAAAILAEGKSSQYTFTLNNRTPGYGLVVPKQSIDFAPNASDPRQGEFGIDAKNWFLRTLVAYVQFFDSQGAPINDPPGWVEQLPAWPPFLREDFETASKKFIASVTAVNVILGIPMPTDPTALDFPWPAEAASCKLFFGGLGTRHWDGVVDPMGILLTGIFQYGIPTLFMLAGAAITSTAWFKAFVADIENIVAAVAVAFPIVGGGVATAAAMMNTKRVLFAFANAIAGILVGPGLRKLSAYIVAKIALSQFAAAAPFVGFAFRIANMAISAVSLAETTVEVLISPATYTVEVKRQLALEATVSPDPLHGTPEEGSVWPKSASRYVAIVQYKNGTNYTVYGDLPEDPSRRADPVVVHFPELPGGGQFQMAFGVYSPTDWLAGNWTSSWMNAVAPSGSGGVLRIAGQIQEQLVPLTPKTQYLYHEKLVYDAASGRHQWQAGDPPTAVVTDLTGPLSQLVNITLNDKAYMLGYTWQASGQNLPYCGGSEPTDGQIYAFQNISTLANPQSALKFPSCGFSGQPYLVYDQFGPAPLFSLDATFQAGLDQGEVTPALRAAFEANAYALPAETTAAVVTPSARWTLSTGLAEPSYDLRREPDGRISVFSYPTPVFSPNNFYVDPRTGVYHLRRVVLDDKTPFDMSPGESYGYFTEPHLDAIVVHPAGYVVGVNYLNSKMEILPIPDRAVPDDQAEPASMVSGQGVRQGLMQGPRALAVTADGRLLVLESINRRVQAFDLNGNPVACFDGAPVAALDAAVFAPELDQGLATVALRDRFAAGGAPLSAHWTITDGADQYDIALDETGDLNLQRNGADLSSEWVVADEAGTYPVKAETDRLVVQAPAPFDLPLEDRQILDRDAVDEEIVAEFQARGGIALSLQAAVSGNGLHVPPSYQVDLARGVISDDLKAAFATRGVVISDEAVLTQRVDVQVRTPGGLWILYDSDSSLSYKISTDPDAQSELAAIRYEPTLELHLGEPGERSTYLDLAVEARGYIYVLSYAGTGSQVSDYQLDLYEPTGKWLSRTPDRSIEPNARGVNGARMIVDLWRNLYTLNFEWFPGPGGRTEPSISAWTPTTPASPNA